MPPISRRDGTFTTARLLPGKYALIVESADANARGESAQTDAGGRFRLTKVVPRDGKLELVTRLGDVIIGAIAPYRAQPGENVDLGTIEMRQERPATPP